MTIIRIYFQNVCIMANRKAQYLLNPGAFLKGLNLITTSPELSREDIPSHHLKVERLAKGMANEASVGVQAEGYYLLLGS